VDMSSSVLAVTWSQFASSSPRLAADIKALFEHYGQAFGYLATVRLDGGPRVHPVSPVIADGALFCFILNSPKRRDLERDGRYALHAYPAENTDDEAYLAGRAHPVADEIRSARLARTHRASPSSDWRLFEFDIEVAMVTHLEPPGQAPEHRIWRAA
jgi:Pyridoxamine 5'-phosphate oxidase